MTVLGVLQYSPLILTNVVLRLCWISTWVWVPVGSPTSTFTDRRFEVRRQISGATDELAIYSVYGKQTVSSGSKVTPFGSQGSYTDSTGLIYLINRYYDPSTDQFLSIDPDVAATDQPFVFTNDDPLNMTDPLGLDEEPFATSGGFAVGTPQPADYASPSPSAESAKFWEGQANRIQAPDEMLGENGPTFMSKTVYQNQDYHIDVENPAPGVRPGQLHLQTYSGEKYLYDPETNSFEDIPKSLAKSTERNPAVSKAVTKGLYYLGGK